MTEQSKEAREGEAVAWQRRMRNVNAGPAHPHFQWGSWKEVDESKIAQHWETGGRIPGFDGLETEIRPVFTHPAAPSADHAELTRLAEAAGGEALGNLLAVIHGDGGHRALEVGTKQAALEAEKIVAGLFAAPSADALRVAVEALEFYRDKVSILAAPKERALFDDKGLRAHQALAALKGDAK